MVQDLSYNLCESLVENIGGVADTGKNNEKSEPLSDSENVPLYDYNDIRLTARK